MDHLLKTFFDRLENAATIPQFRDAMAEMAAGFDLQAFAYIAAPVGAERPLLITNYAEGWAKHYFARQYQLCDPIVLRAWRYPGPFEWGPDLARSSASILVRSFFDEAACFGIRYGYTIPIRCWRGRTAALTFSTDRFRGTYRNSIRKSAYALYALALQFHASVRERFELWHSPTGVALTFRQRQCLALAEQGKSIGEIAQLIGKSPRTAKFHIDNAKAKFGVRTTREAAVAYALARHGLHPF